MPDRHHYVPIALLKHFAQNEKIWLFDKHEGKSFKTNVRNAFVEGNYNTITGEGVALEAEHIFTRAEAAAAPILQKILSQQNVCQLSVEDHAQLAMFVTVQHLRSKQSRRNFTIIREHMQKNFPGIPQSNFPLQRLNEVELDKFASLDFIMKNLAHLTQLVAAKHLVLIESSGTEGFLLSDQPVVLHNDNPSPHMSNIGLAVSGIQIYLPISPDFAIAFFCPTLLRELEDGLTKIDKTRSSFFAQCFAQGNIGISTDLVMADIKMQRAKVEKTLVSMRDVRKIKFNKQNLLFMNSRQVAAAYRFVASHKSSFALVMDMLKQDPSLRKPNQIAFG